jgi:hypothetical protein
MKGTPLIPKKFEKKDDGTISITFKSGKLEGRSDYCVTKRGELVRLQPKPLSKKERRKLRKSNAA